MFAIPPASDICERLFSFVKLLITDICSRLKMNIIKVNECLQSWFRPPDKSAFDIEKEETIIKGDGDEEITVKVPDKAGEELIVTDYNSKDYAHSDKVLKSYDDDIEEVIFDGEE